MKYRGKRIVIAALLLALLCGCGAAPQEEHKTEPAGDGPYLSITYGCNNAEMLPAGTWCFTPMILRRGS